MDIEHYAFALFIAVLVCLIAVLIKLLFSNVRRKNKMLDEKEEKLLQLYRSVENIMEEFNEQIKTAIDDIKDHEQRAAERLSTITPPPPPPQPETLMSAPTERKPQPEKQKKPMTVDSSRIRAASEVLERAERMVKNRPPAKEAPAAAGSGGQVIHRLFDDAPDEQQAAEPEAQAKNNRRDSILALAEEGRTYAQIARELGITQNEVKLVIDLNDAPLP